MKIRLFWLKIENRLRIFNQLKIFLVVNNLIFELISKVKKGERNGKLPRMLNFEALNDCSYQILQGPHWQQILQKLLERKSEVNLLWL